MLPGVSSTQSTGGHHWVFSIKRVRELKILFLLFLTCQARAFLWAALSILLLHWHTEHWLLTGLSSDYQFWKSLLMMMVNTHTECLWCIRTWYFSSSELGTFGLILSIKKLRQKMNQNQVIYWTFPPAKAHDYYFLIIEYSFVPIFLNWILHQHLYETSRTVQRLSEQQLENHSGLTSTVYLQKRQQQHVVERFHGLISKKFRTTIGLQ